MNNHKFAIGFALGLIAFLLANALAAHLASDCGLPAVLGASACADDIRRAGFPLIFWESGGFAFHTSFNLGALVVDLVAGLVVSVACGLIAQRLASRKAP